MTTQDQVLKFITNNPPCGGLTARELSGGLQLPIEEVRSAVESLLTAAVIRAVDASLPANFQRYVPASATVAAPAPPEQPWRSTAEIWAAEARARGLAEWKRNHPRPEPPKRYEPTEQEIESELAKKKVEPLSAAEYEESLRRPRHINNPQLFIQK